MHVYVHSAITGDRMHAIEVPNSEDMPMLLASLTAQHGTLEITQEDQTGDHPHMVIVCEDTGLKRFMDMMQG